MHQVTTPPAIAILIPCLNEELTIGKVISDFQQQLPQAVIYVFDNDSTDQTAAIAQTAGAVVMVEKRRGKGFVVQSMFEKVEADFFIMVDGDDTYPAERVHALLAPVMNDGFDMAVGSRIVQGTQSGFRPLNWLGNLFYQYVVNLIFKAKLTDILSGYRCMNYNFVKGLPIFVTGFEVETELTIKALERGFQITEVPVELRSRPAGSHSKIRLVHDGLKILSTIFALFRDYKPFTFFGSIGLMFMLVGLLPGLYTIYEYALTGMALHFPLAILAVGLELAGLLLVVMGLVLHTINRRFQELEHLLHMRIH